MDIFTYLLALLALKKSQRYPNKNLFAFTTELSEQAVKKYLAC